MKLAQISRLSLCYDVVNKEVTIAKKDWKIAILDVSNLE
jgi:hypothetical protein